MSRSDWNRKRGTFGVMGGQGGTQAPMGTPINVKPGGLGAHGKGLIEMLEDLEEGKISMERAQNTPAKGYVKADTLKNIADFTGVNKGQGMNVQYEMPKQFGNWLDDLEAGRISSAEAAKVNAHKYQRSLPNQIRAGAASGLSGLLRGIPAAAGALGIWGLLNETPDSNAAFHKEIEQDAAEKTAMRNRFYEDAANKFTYHTGVETPWSGGDLNRISRERSGGEAEARQNYLKNYDPRPVNYLTGTKGPMAVNF